MATTATIEDLQELVSKETGLGLMALDLDSPVEKLGIASIDIVSIVFAIEDRYDVTIEAEELPPAKTFGELLIGLKRLIDDRQATKAA